MKRLLIISFFLFTILAIYSSFESVLNTSVSQGKTTNVTRGPLTVWSVYEGRLEARNNASITSRFSGNATVIELAPDGVKASKGDVLVRFDSSALEREVIKLERDYLLAKSELDSLKNATLTLELRDIEIKLLEVQTALSAEQQYLDASIQLAKENLVSEQEIKQQKLKVAEISTQLETLELKIGLTKEYLHPSKLKRSQAKLASAEQELKLAEKQMQNSVIRAPSDGVVVYRPIHIGTEFRTVRVGDRIYPNQPFMALPDMNNMVVHCEIPESELSRIQAGKDVVIHPLAYPETNLHGTVEMVGSMARKLPGSPSWQKFFHVVIGLKLKDVDSRLKPGMSVTTHILSYHNPDALLIPRAAVWWEDEKAFGKIITTTSQETRQIKLGMADEENYEVIEGLKAKDQVLIEPE